MGQQNVWGEGSVAVDQIRPARTRTTVASTLASSAGSSFSKVFSRCFSRGNYLPCVPPSLQTIFKPLLMKGREREQPLISHIPLAYMYLKTAKNRRRPKFR